MGRRVVVWRHGRTAWNFGGRFQGQEDVPLDATGIEQARHAARILAALSPAAIVSSDLERAMATAAELAAVTSLPVLADPGLRETHLGAWQGLTRAEVEERFPGEAQAWLAGSQDRRGGGESMVEVADRAEAAIASALEKVDADGTLIVVTHGGSGRVMIARMIGLPPEHWKALGALSNCCWSVLAQRKGRPHAGDGGDRWALMEHNAGTLPQPVLSDDR